MFDPGTESVVGRGDRPKLGRHLAPLTSGAGQPDQAIKDGPGVTGRAAAFLAWFINDQQWGQTRPERV